MPQPQHRVNLPTAAPLLVHGELKRDETLKDFISRLEARPLAEKVYIHLPTDKVLREWVEMDHRPLTPPFKERTQIIDEALFAGRNGMHAMLGLRYAAKLRYYLRTKIRKMYMEGREKDLTGTNHDMHTWGLPDLIKRLDEEMAQLAHRDELALKAFMKSQKPNVIQDFKSVMKVFDDAWLSYAGVPAGTRFAKLDFKDADKEWQDDYGKRAFAN